jgi:hypothetical protein
VLTWWSASLLLGGIGVAWLSGNTAARARAAVAAALVLGVCLVSGVEAWRGSRDHHYAYAQTTPDVDLIQSKLRKFPSVPVLVATRQNPWPLPWYLREFPNVNWTRSLPPGVPLAPVILATPEMEADLVRRIYEDPPPGQRELYTHLFDRPVWLRPGVELRGYAAHSLREKQ